MRPRFVSKSAFKNHFAEYRKQSGKQVITTYDPLTGYFHATKSSNIQEQYQIKLYPDKLTCTCGDWDAQKQLGLSKPTCKHCYAVLDYIGCSSLEDYIKRQGFEFLNTNETLHEYDNPLKDWHDELMAQETYHW